ncbi:hypothetical protein [Mongoliitalea daihaiensis]|nr:hypothetical protein [Mongoliitalea daihaiensis]
MSLKLTDRVVVGEVVWHDESMEVIFSNLLMVNLNSGWFKKII